MYDVIFIGGGPGGYWGARKAADAGFKTLLFERESLGGVCVREGCIPSKTFLHGAKVNQYAAASRYINLDHGHLKFDFHELVKKKDSVVSRLSQGIENDLKKAGVEIINEEARVSGIGGGKFVVEASSVSYESQYLVLAAGSEIIIPPIEGLKDSMKSGYTITHREFFELDELPGSITIIGGGYIGIEFASFMCDMGKKVVIAEQADRLIPSMDSELSAVIKRVLERKGTGIYLESTVESVIGNKVIIQKEGIKEEINSDMIILCTGRKSSPGSVINVTEFNLEMYQGAVKTDDRCMTSINNLYAIGDINGRSMLAHTAYREADVCVNTISGINDSMNYDRVPFVVYTSPEIASIGLSEDMAKEMNIDFQTVKLPLGFSGRYLAENDAGRDFCKLLIGNDKKILGFHMLGPYASEIITQVTIAITGGMTVDDLKKVVFPHPTVSEIIHEMVHR